MKALEVRGCRVTVEQGSVRGKDTRTAPGVIYDLRVGGPMDAPTEGRRQSRECPGADGGPCGSLGGEGHVLAGSESEEGSEAVLRILDILLGSRNSRFSAARCREPICGLKLTLAAGYVGAEVNARTAPRGLWWPK